MSAFEPAPSTIVVSSLVITMMAAAASFRRSDRRDTEVTSISAVVVALRAHAPGDAVVLRYWRAGRANGILTLDPAAPSQIREVALVYKLHIVLGLTLFIITPFTRLVHIWSAPVWFLLRPGYQIVRSRRSDKPNYSLTRGPAGVAPSYGGPAVLRQQAESGEAGA